jgi:rod shape-determining protein MreD
MRNFIIYLCIYIFAIVVQFSWAKYFVIFGLFPNVILLMLLFIGLTRGSTAGQLLGFSLGLTWDVLSVDLFGSHAFLCTVVGYLSGKLARKWDESKIATQVIIAGFASVFFWLGIDITRMIFGENAPGIRSDYIVIVQIFYNMIIAPIIFGIAKFIGYYFVNKETFDSFS